MTFEVVINIEAPTMEEAYKLVDEVLRVVPGLSVVYGPTLLDVEDEDEKEEETKEET